MTVGFSFLVTTLFWNKYGPKINNNENEIKILIDAHHVWFHKLTLKKQTQLIRAMFFTYHIFLAIGTSVAMWLSLMFLEIAFVDVQRRNKQM